MSLTSFLNKVEVRKKFREELEYPKLKSKAAPVAKPLTNHSSVVGIAFDYLLRFFIEGQNSNVVKRTWSAVNHITEIGSDSTVDIDPIAKRIVANTEKSYVKYLEDKKVTTELLKDLLRLAKLDIYFKSGSTEELELVDDADVQDLRRIFQQINPEDWVADELAILNPTFNEASAMFGGADADLILDDMLIEIKTVRELEIKKDYINQLVGYYLLSKISGITGVEPSQEVEILKFGIYFSRFGVLKLYYVEDIISEEATNRFVAWFKELSGGDK